MTTREKSTEQEKRVTKKLGLKISPNSGATKFFKSDLYSSTFLVECKDKMKKNKNFTIKREYLEKLQQEKYQQGRPFSALAFSFGDGVDFFVIDFNLFQILFNYLENGENPTD